jgi:hypothetical protein
MLLSQRCAEGVLVACWGVDWAWTVEGAGRWPVCILMCAVRRRADRVMFML